MLSFGGRWDGRGTGHESNFGNDAFATEQDKSGAGRDARRRRGREDGTKNGIRRRKF